MRTHFCGAFMKKTLLSVTLLLLVAAIASAQTTVNLTAQPTSVTMPDGKTVDMWGYCTPDATGAGTPLSGGAACTSPAGGLEAWADDYRTCRNLADDQPEQHAQGFDVGRDSGTAGWHTRPAGARCGDRPCRTNADDLARRRRCAVQSADAGRASAFLCDRSGRERSAILYVFEPETRNLYI